MGPITVTRTKRNPDVVMTATRYPLLSNNIIIAVVSPSSLNPGGIASPAVSFLSLSSLSTPDMNRRKPLDGSPPRPDTSSESEYGFHSFISALCAIILPPPPSPVALLSPLPPPSSLYARFSSPWRCACYPSPLEAIFYVYFGAYIGFLSKQFFG